MSDRTGPVIRGVVNARHEVVVRLRLRSPRNPGLDVDAVLDKKFTASLTLPAATITALGLTPHTSGRAVLADGSPSRFDIYATEVSWDGAWQPLLVYGLGDVPLLGMELLARHELRIAVVPVGAVEITPLP